MTHPKGHSGDHAATVLYAAPSQADEFPVFEVTRPSRDNETGDFQTLAWCPSLDASRQIARALNVYEGAILTEGPLYVLEPDARDSDTEISIYGAGGQNLAEVYFGKMTPPGTDPEMTARLFAKSPNLLDVLQDTVEELKACSAWQDALEGDDDMMLETVNKAEALIAAIKGEEFTPHKVGDEL